MTKMKEDLFAKHHELHIYALEADYRAAVDVYLQDIMKMTPSAIIGPEGAERFNELRAQVAPLFVESRLRKDLYECVRSNQRAREEGERADPSPEPSATE